MSNKEQKKQIREQKQRAEKRRQQITGVLLKVAVVVTVVLALLVFYQGIFTGAEVLPPDEISAADQQRGNPESGNTLVMYADFQCPSCARENELIARAWPRINQNVLLAFRHYPLDNHRHSFLAARYAEAAGRQGKFWEMQDLLFANQALWASLNEADTMFDSFAESLNLDMQQLHQDLEAEGLRAKIIADQRGGNRAGVRGTPVLFFNGDRIPNPGSAQELVNLINSAP